MKDKYELSITDAKPGDGPEQATNQERPRRRYLANKGCSLILWFLHFFMLLPWNQGHVDAVLIVFDIKQRSAISSTHRDGTTIREGIVPHGLSCILVSILKGTLGIQSYLLRRHLDPPNPPQTPSEVRYDWIPIGKGR